MKTFRITPATGKWKLVDSGTPYIGAYRDHVKRPFCGAVFRCGGEKLGVKLTRQELVEAIELIDRANV